MRNQLPIIQNFFGRPVRFFKAEFWVEIEKGLGGYRTPPILISSWGIPFPDFCDAIGQDKKEVRRKIKLDKEVYEGLYITVPIPDALGRLRPTILMAQEMCDFDCMKYSFWCYHD
jgi:hypothetical protein